MPLERFVATLNSLRLLLNSLFAEQKFVQLPVPEQCSSSVRPLAGRAECVLLVSLQLWPCQILDSIWHRPDSKTSFPKWPGCKLLFPRFGDFSVTS